MSASTYYRVPRNHCCRSPGSESTPQAQATTVANIALLLLLVLLLVLRISSASAFARRICRASVSHRRQARATTPFFEGRPWCPLSSPRLLQPAAWLRCCCCPPDVSRGAPPSASFAVPSYKLPAPPGPPQKFFPRRRVAGFGVMRINRSNRGADAPQMQPQQQLEEFVSRRGLLLLLRKGL